MILSALEVEPRRSLLLVGEPGVGKTALARAALRAAAKLLHRLRGDCGTGERRRDLHRRARGPGRRHCGPPQGAIEPSGSCPGSRRRSTPASTRAARRGCSTRCSRTSSRGSSRSSARSRRPQRSCCWASGPASPPPLISSACGRWTNARRSRSPSTRSSTTGSTWRRTSRRSPRATSSLSSSCPPSPPRATCCGSCRRRQPRPPSRNALDSPRPTCSRRWRRAPGCRWPCWTRTSLCSSTTCARSSAGESSVRTEAVDCIVERIAMVKAGLTDPTRPLGVFLLRRPDRHRQDGDRQGARGVHVRLAGAADPARHERVPDARRASSGCSRTRASTRGPRT